MATIITPDQAAQETTPKRNTPWKDPRITFKGKRIEVNGTFVTFDGKGNPVTKVLKIYRMHGDVGLFAEAIQNFAIEFQYEKVYAPYF